MPTLENVDTLSPIAYPGAGKGTAIDFLKQPFQVSSHFEVGDRMRTLIGKSDPRALACKEFSDRGVMVPRQKIMPIIREGIGGLNPDEFWFIDGFPRTPQQVDDYLALMSEYGRQHKLLHLSLGDRQESRNIAEERMIERGLAAQKSGKKPRKEDIDPKVRATRLDEADQLYEVLDRFPSDRIITIDARGDIEQTRAQLTALLRGLPGNEMSYAA